MRKLILEVQVSIDGYIAETDGKTDWMLWNWGPEWKWCSGLRKYHTDLTKSADCIFLSRKIEEELFIAHWRKVTEHPDDPQYAFARHITDTHKVVFTKTLGKSDTIPGGWNNASIAKGGLTNEINQLKSQNGKEIIVYGGATLVASLIKARLIDEFHILVNPVAIGNGLPIFNTLGSKQNMTLIQSESFTCGMVLLHYKSKNT